MGKGVFSTAVAALVGLVLLVIQPSIAAAEDFYKGRTINLVVAYPAGDGNDVYARLLAQFLGRHIAGNPMIVVNDMPGADGLLAANYLYNVAPKDGLTIGIVSRSVALQEKMGNSGVKFEAAKFDWLGTSSSYQNDGYCLMVRSDVPVNSIADMQKSSRPILFGASATPGDSGYDVVEIAREVFKLNINLIKGYTSPETMLAIQRGELDGRGIGLSALSQFRKDWAQGNGAKFLVQFGHKARWKGLPNVPTAEELATTPEDEALIALVELPLVMARPYVAPPGIPADREKILRDAFMATHADADFLAEAKKMNLDISPSSGEDIDTLLAGISKIPPEVVERYKMALTK